MTRLLPFLNISIKNLFYAIFFLIPLVLYPKTFELFEFNKLWALFAISAVILFMWGSKMIIEKKIIFKRTPFDIPILLFLISQIISTFISIDSHVSFWGYYSRFNGGLLSIATYIFLYFAFVSNFPHEKNEHPENEVEYDENGIINRKYFSAAFISIVVFSFLVSLTQGLSFFQDIFLFLTFLAPCFFFIKAYAFPPIKKLILIMLSGGFIVALWGFSSHFGYDFTCLLFRGSLDVSCWTDAFQPMVRLFSTLGQPNWLSAYFSVLIPISLVLSIYNFASENISGQQYKVLSAKYFLGNKNRVFATSYGLLTILLFAEVLWTQSLSGYIGLLCGLLAFSAGLILIILKKRKFTSIIKESLFKTLLVFFVIFFACAFFLGNPLQGRIPPLSFNGVVNLILPSSSTPKKVPSVPIGEELGGSDSGKIRLVVWKGALEIFRQHPLFGTGVETFAYSYYKVKPKEHNLLSEWDFLYNKAHNEYLNYLATTGIIGLGTYLIMIGWFMLYSVRWLLKKGNVSDLKTLLVLSFLGSYITILVSNFFGFSVVVINLFMFFIPALVFYITSAPKTHIEETGEMNPWKMIGIVALGIICLFMELQLLNFWFADQSYSMGYNLDRAQQYVDANKYLEDSVNLYPGEDLYKSELSLNLATLGLLLSQQNRATDAATFVNRSTDMSQQVITSHPQNIVFYKTRVQTLFELSEINPKFYEEAIQAISEARKLAPTDAKLAYNEGLLFGQKGDLTDAITVLKESIELKPNYKESRYALAVYLSQLAKKEQDEGKKQELITEAKANLQYILQSITPNDKQTGELLKSLE